MKINIRLEYLFAFVTVQYLMCISMSIDYDLFCVYLKYNYLGLQYELSLDLPCPVHYMF